ncbi:LON peptidase substrate-binding domain-containing protein [Brevundimonas sp. SORGH_AS_0993]|uniref:LON peptidase substrate-binding domain-containing protein n=1 Tax=Brevundimonas sp. SORGH_AS_0993 TaxID=3041794 RepID=UPI0027858719|nr:LON peptidase substrate-binding domain-containing protein [Brevundimonas sp. SORGH_AS_0993]MDQ1155003.1 Lon protease-like protein [Brevundimonas sp. SORGH_AS_0993]
MPQAYVKASDLPQVIPVFPLSGVILLARGQLPLNVFEPRYLNMVDDAMAGDRLIGLVQPTGGTRALPGLSPVGCAGRITSFAETSDGRYLITLTGISRFRIAAELPSKAPYRQVRAAFEDYAADLASPVEEPDFDRDGFLDALRGYLAHRAMDIDWDTAESAPMEALVNSLSMALPFEPAEKQALLEANGLMDRAQALTALLRIDAADGGDGDAPPIQ